MTTTARVEKAKATSDSAVFAYWVPEDYIPVHGKFQTSLLDNPNIIHILEEIEEASTDDMTNWCDCKPDKDAGLVDTDHQHHCKLFNHWAWLNLYAEWVPWLQAFVYIGEQNLVLAKHPAAPKTNTLVPFIKGSKKQKKQKNQKHTLPSKSGYTFIPKCRHYGASVTMPDGTVIGVSSHFTRTTTDTIPDFGVYLSSTWSPKNYLSYYLPWQDYGLPQVASHVVEGVVDEILFRARNGQHVEIGCIGGHGRTGSLLALIVQRAGLDDPYTAVEWVRKNYCKEAIEHHDQEWYVKMFAAALVGDPLPPRPPKPEPKSYTPPAKTVGNWPTSGYSPNKISEEHRKEILARYGYLTEEDRKAAKERAEDQKCPVCGRFEIDRSSGYSCSNSECELFWVRYTKRGEYIDDLEDWDMIVNWSVSADDLADPAVVINEDFAAAKTLYAESEVVLGHDDGPDKPIDPDDLADMHATLSQMYGNDDYLMGGWFE